VWQRRRDQPLAILLCVLSVAFFAVIALRLAPAAWEVGNRLGEFAFIGVAFVIAFVPFFGPGRLATRRRGPVLVAGALTLMVIGGAVAGWPASVRLARPSRITAEGHDIESDPILLGRWVGAHLRGATFAALQSEARTILLYGRSPILETPDLDQNLITQLAIPKGDIAYLARRDVRYVVVDLRPRAQDNAAGYYFSVRRGGPPDPLLSYAAAQKFDQVGATRVWDSGYLFVYDLSSLEATPTPAVNRCLLTPSCLVGFGAPFPPGPPPIRGGLQ
jgi:hypothetical protein